MEGGFGGEVGTDASVILSILIEEPPAPRTITLADLILLTQPHIVININGSRARGRRKEAEGGGHCPQRNLRIRDLSDKLSQFCHLLLLSLYPFA